MGDVNTNWFYCANWEGLKVPTATTSVTVSSSSINNAEVDFTAAYSDDYSDLASCNDLTVTGKSVIVAGSINNKLEVNGDLLIDSAGILDMDDSNSTTLDGELYLHGNWINLTNTAFEEGNGTVIFTGITPQIITYGTAPLPPIVTEQYYNVILNNSFDTNVSNDLFLHGNLTINSGNTLTITDGRYTYVDNIVTNNGVFNINNNGSLIQVKDVDNIGNISMERTVSIRRQDYVYWSSPVNNFNVNNVSTGTPTSLIYKWDPTAPNGVAGGEGYWISAAGETMIEGKGYIVRGDSSFPTNTLTSFPAVFNNGTPNNGDVTVSVSRGTINPGVDDNWNLVGNPYPSSISAMTFLTTNTNLDGFVNLWTHGALPSLIPDPFYEQNGGYNYDANDYITYNGTGTTSGPAGFNGYIAAGQSFMVNLIDGPPVAQNITFQNVMRDRTYDNSQFYRLSSTSTNDSSIISDEKHRIWLDLVSETEEVDRILLGYIPNATMSRDRLYDAVSTHNDEEQHFYSLIDNASFIIQGRALPFSDADVIPLGFNCPSAGNYSIAIHAVDGLFDNQTVYLKDNLLNFTHNLMNSPYTFASDLGEFNDRFEIVFIGDALSINDYELSPNELSIIELANGNVKFIVSPNFEIETIEIIDLLGRSLYHLSGNSHTEIYNLSNLSQAAYIAKVKLTNGQVITKRAIKR